MSTKINQLQLLQQNVQNLLNQKQQMQNQVLELDSALIELKTTKQAYRIVGKIMLAASKEELTKQLEEKREIVELRIKNFAQQEERLQKQVNDLQREVMEELKNKNSEE
ncbi:prefoldin subunit beta [Candidatus Woesearchaeota archaeon CG_4_10_14_0_2_um_filter_33_13]|nr:MAG: prefoldin subunit beta [Candidatus Woesearchaeota archaeon CG_4_10_14_0_2_um_filter_33_13]